MKLVGISRYDRRLVTRIIVRTYSHVVLISSSLTPDSHRRRDATRPSSRVASAVWIGLQQAPATCDLR